MRIFLNNQPVDLPSDCITVDQLVALEKLNPTSTAVAIDNKLVPKEKWNITKLTPLCLVTAFSAAFGG